MDNPKQKKTIQDMKLTPTKGVRKPGAARSNQPQSGEPTFRRTTAPKPQTTKQPMLVKKSSSLFGQEKSAPTPVKKTNTGTLKTPTGGGIRKPGQVSGQRPINRVNIDVDDMDFTQKKTSSKDTSGETSRISLKTRKNWNSRIKNTSSAPKILVIALIMVVVMFFSAFLSYTYLVDRYSNPVTLESIVMDPDSSVPFKIEKGSTTEDIAKNLKKQDLIGSKFLYKFLSKFNGYDGSYKAGTYTLCDDLSYDEIMVILSSNPESVKITIPEGFTTEQIATRLEANGVCTAAEFLKAVETQDLKSYTFVTKHENRDHRLDGYLFPDTYEFDIDASPETIIYKLLNRFNEIWTPEYQAKADAIGLTQDQVMILASLVEEEARAASERAKIAGVFINRLNSDSYKKLQSCATIKYAYAKVLGQNLETVTKEHTNISDPYNTYKNEGLPPGPISNPGKASIEAVLNYARHDYYFFVVKSDGSNGHTFSKTYAEHVAAQGF